MNHNNTKVFFRTFLADFDGKKNKCNIKILVGCTNCAVKEDYQMTITKNKVSDLLL